MILEGLLNTQNEDQSTNIAPMGVVATDSMQTFELRPFQSSRSFANLRRHPEGVFHVTDDVLVLARAAIDLWDSTPALLPARRVDGRVLESACRWYEFRIASMDASKDRASVAVQVVHQEHQRDFFGFNRAKHAVLEAAILATRIQVLPRDKILDGLQRLVEPVEKTGGASELRAFALLRQYVEHQLRITVNTTLPS
jgi:uncharacterized protein